MKLVVFYKSGFLEWANDILTQMMVDVPDLKIIALASETSVYNALKKNKDVPFHAVHDLQALEYEWFNAPADYKALKILEDRFGSDSILKTFIADKAMGCAWDYRSCCL